MRKAAVGRDSRRMSVASSVSHGSGEWGSVYFQKVGIERMFYAYCQCADGECQGREIPVFRRSCS